MTAWRGPCTILERLSATAYAAVDDTTKRRYERVIANILPYKAARAKKNADASFSQTYSAPFSIGEFIAIRDEPTGPYYVALVQTVTAKCIRVQYYGTTGIVLADAVFNHAGMIGTAMKFSCNGICPIVTTLFKNTSLLIPARLA